MFGQSSFSPFCFSAFSGTSGSLIILKFTTEGCFLSYSGSVVLNFSCFLSVHQFLSVLYTQWKHFAKQILAVVVLHKAEMQWVWQYGMWVWVWWVWVWWVWDERITWAAGGVWQEDKADSASSDPSEWVLCCCVPCTPQTQPPALIPILAMLPEVLLSWESWQQPPVRYPSHFTAHSSIVRHYRVTKSVR